MIPTSQPKYILCKILKRLILCLERISFYGQSSAWIMNANRCVHVGLSLHLLTFIGDLRYEMLLI